MHFLCCLYCFLSIKVVLFWFYEGWSYCPRIRLLSFENNGSRLLYTTGFSLKYIYIRAWPIWDFLGADANNDIREWENYNIWYNCRYPLCNILNVVIKLVWQRYAMEVGYLTNFIPNIIAPDRKHFTLGPFDIFGRGTLEVNRGGSCFFNLSLREGTLFLIWIPGRVIQIWIDQILNSFPTWEFIKVYWVSSTTPLLARLFGMIRGVVPLLLPCLSIFALGLSR